MKRLDRDTFKLRIIDVYLKALVLGKLDMVKLKDGDEKGFMYSDIHKEIELLLMEI